MWLGLLYVPKMKKKYGFKLDKRKPEDYIFGGGNVPMEKLVEDGNWQDFLPVKEFQNLNNVEPYACVPFTVLNCVETLIKKKYGEERNYSDRFLAYVTDTKNGGSSPHECAEFLRKLGVPTQDEWPFDEAINTSEKFFAKPEPKIYELAREFNEEWSFKHEYVENKPEAISEALKCSPLLISVTAWFSRNGLYYKPNGRRDNHATTMFYERAGEFRRVFDSYDSPHIKDYEWSATPEVIKRFWIEKKAVYETKLNLMERIIVALGQLIGLIKAEKPIVAPSPVLPQPEPIGSLLFEWAKAIEVYEGANKAWNNPGAIRSKSGPFLKFPTYQAGFDYLCAYLTRCATGQHPAYKKGGELTLLEFQKIYSPSSDNNNPLAYATFVAKRLNVSIDEKIKNLV